jgi:hypothetical protein
VTFLYRFVFKCIPSGYPPPVGVLRPYRMLPSRMLRYRYRSPRRTYSAPGYPPCGWGSSLPPGVPGRRLGRPLECNSVLVSLFGDIPSTRKRADESRKHSVHGLLARRVKRTKRAEHKVWGTQAYKPQWYQLLLPGTRDHPDWTLAGGGSVTHRRATKRMAF